jgi:radical SAM protein with 4Fe4S-binding SPASM domain
MPVEDFALVWQRVGSFCGIVHLHGFGEPLLDRQLVRKIGLLKEVCPAAHALTFTTLGVRLQEAFFTQLAASGLDTLIISLYGYTRAAYSAVHGYDGFSLVRRNLELLSQAMRKAPGRLHACIKIPGRDLAACSFLPTPQPPEKREFCVWAQELGFEIREWSYVHNYGGGRTYNQPGQERLCPVVSGKRRHILNVTWELDVVPCCYDFNAAMRFGNLRRNTLEEIFSDRPYLDFIAAHQKDDLTRYPVCQNCEKSDYR